MIGQIPKLRKTGGESGRLSCSKVANQMLLTSVCFVLLGGCGTLTNPYRQWNQDFPAQLLTGAEVFGEEVHSDEVPEVDILATNAEMQAFAEYSLSGNRQLAVRFKRLMSSLLRDGYFDSNYQPNETNTAAETFERKAGNCLSYTNMFIALARTAGLDARYQVVEVAPSWDGASGYLIRYTHINVLLRGVRLDKIHGEDFTIDFNEVHPDPDDQARVVSDDYATSLYYANHSVNLFLEGRNRAAFAYMRRAIEMEPDNPDFWINLGAFYAKLEHYRAAITAYEWVLQLDRGSRGAMSGLSRAYSIVGDQERATYYEEQVRRYRDRNAYYHYAVAQTEFESERYAEALEAINTAIDLKSRNGRFFFMKGLTERMLGDIDAAQKSFRRAARHGSFSDLKRRYRDELEGVSLTSAL